MQECLQCVGHWHVSDMGTPRVLKCLFFIGFSPLYICYSKDSKYMKLEFSKSHMCERDCLLQWQKKNTKWNKNDIKTFKFQNKKYVSFYISCFLYFACSIMAIKYVSNSKYHNPPKAFRDKPLSSFEILKTWSGTAFFLLGCQFQTYWNS